MPVNVQGPDGKMYQFPDSTTKDQAVAYFKKKRIGQQDVVSAAPPLMSLRGLENKAMTLRDEAVSQLPAVGGLLGGILGAGAGAETGPGAVVTAGAGAAAGGGLGEDVRQVLNEKFHPEDKMGPIESGVRMAGQAGLQGVNELTGQVAGRTVGNLLRPVGEKIGPAILNKYPILKPLFAVAEEGASPRAAQNLTAAAANKQNAGVALEAIGRTMSDLEGEMTKLPPSQRTVEGFLKAVNSRKDAMNAEYGAALLPVSGQKTVPMGVVQNIRNLARSYMGNTVEGRRQMKYILDRASEYQKPWTFGQLDQLRSDLATQTAKHRMKEPVAKYAAEKGDLDLQIDNAILDGLRDTVYPEIDRAAGKPQGYFEDMKGRQSSLINLQAILDRRVKDLKGAQAISEVAPRFSSENFSGSLHAGSAPRLGIYGIRQALKPTREMTEASKHVGKAFPSVNALPYTVLFGTGIRASEYPLTGPKKRVAATLQPQ